MKIIAFLLIISFDILAYVAVQPENVTIAILAKDKAHTLPEYLRCIENQTWPKNKTNIYIRTNNNNDETVAVLKNWVARVKDQYLEIYFDDTDVPERVQDFKQHEWNCTRFTVLGKIRQESVQWAKNRYSHYFVADCDNFIKPRVIETLVQTGLPVVGPFLICAEPHYSNYHSAIDPNGYFEAVPMYYSIYKQEVKGLVEVPVIHCTYLIRNEYLETVCYDDLSYRYEYVIFSDQVRKNGLRQYLDNREIYGRITMAEDRAGFLAEPWYPELAGY